MRAYSIFDDYPKEAVNILSAAGVEVNVHPMHVPRPDDAEMKSILKEYDCVIIGTSQRITEDMLEDISTRRIIGTASVGIDHIHIPSDKGKLVTIINTPKANAQSVAEYTIGCALASCKRLAEGNRLYLQGENNKQLHSKPEDLNGKTLGVVGAGYISGIIMEYGRLLGMKVLCWTAHPEHHNELAGLGVAFVDLDSLISIADVISVNLPNNAGTSGLISRERIALMKETATFISVSRRDTLDIEALLERAEREPNFYVCLDLDVDLQIVSRLSGRPNVLVTPHIAGGTVETRKRMFMEVAQRISSII